MKLNKTQKIEITHDILAREVYARLDATEKMRLKIIQFMRDRYDYYVETRILLDKKDLEYVDPYLARVELSADQRDFVHKSRKDVTARERKKQRRNLTIGSVLALAAIVATVFGIQASNAAIRASESEAQAQAAKLEALTAAEKTKKVNSELKAKQDTLDSALTISEQRRTEAEGSNELALKSTRQAKMQARRADSLGQVARQNLNTLNQMTDKVTNLVLEKNGFQTPGDTTNQLPYLVLYFDNDRPNWPGRSPNRAWRDFPLDILQISAQSYLETLKDYQDRFDEILAQFSESEQDFLHMMELEFFFQQEIKVGGGSELALEKFVNTAKEFFKLNIPIVVEVTDCDTQPKSFIKSTAADRYNKNLLLRRIDSVDQELKKLGLTKEKLGRLYKFEQVDKPCNTPSRAPSITQDELMDQNNRKLSVFSIDAFLRRRIEVSMRIGDF